jgi:hypothetical protein
VNFSVLQPAFLKIGICPDFTYFWVKDIPLQILIGWTGQTGRLLNQYSSVREKPSD